MLPASVPVRNTPSQPSMAAKNGYKHARLGEGEAQRRVHAGVARDVAQAEHEGDGRDRDLHLDDRSAGSTAATCCRFIRSRSIDSSAAKKTALPGDGQPGEIELGLLRLRSLDAFRSLQVLRVAQRLCSVRSPRNRDQVIRLDRAETVSAWTGSLAVSVCRTMPVSNSNTDMMRERHPGQA